MRPCSVCVGRHSSQEKSLFDEVAQHFEIRRLPRYLFVQNFAKILTQHEPVVAGNFNQRTFSVETLPSHVMEEITEPFRRRPGIRGKYRPDPRHPVN